MTAQDQLIAMLYEERTARADAEARMRVMAADHARQMEESPMIAADSEALSIDLAKVGRGSKVAAVWLHRQFCKTGLKESTAAIGAHWPQADEAAP